MSEALQQEIRHLRTLEGSARDPRDRIFLPLADAHFRLGEYDAAADMLREGLTRLPDFVAAHVLMGRVLEARGDLDEAEETWAAARRLDPLNAEALLALGRILVGRGEAVGGELVLRARALDPTAGGQEPDADLVSVADLAPGSSTDVASEPVSVAELAPEAGDVMSIADLAPDPTPKVETVDDHPEDPAGADPDTAGDDTADTQTSSVEADRPIDDRRVVTRTLAELLAAQGQRPRAIDMYEELVARSPDDAVLGDRLRELRDMGESGGAEPGKAESRPPVPPDHDDDALDHRLTRPDPDPDTPTPFAWTEDGHGGGARSAKSKPAAGADTDSESGDPDAPSGTEPRIADYLGGLLSRSPSSPSGDASSS